MAIDGGTRSKLLVPVGAGLAFAVAVGVWLIPLPKPQPDAMPPMRATEGGASAEPAARLARSWEELVAPMERVRDIPVVPTPVAEAPEAEPEVAEAESEDAPPADPGRQEASPALGWRYVGFIEQPGGTAALFSVGGSQRVVMSGDRVPGAGDEGGVLEIEKVTAEELWLTFRDRAWFVRYDGGPSGGLTPLGTPAAPTDTEGRGGGRNEIRERQELERRA